MMAIDTAAALRKLQSGQALTAEEKAALGIGPAVAPVIAEPTLAETIGASDPNSPEYYTKVLANGKTQAQIDALKNAFTTAATIRNESKTTTARVDPVTGKVVTGPKGTVLTGSTGSTGTTGVSGSGTIYTAPDGTIFTDLNKYNAYIADTKLQDKAKLANSAYNTLYEEFNKYGLGSLVSDIKDMLIKNYAPSEYNLALQNTEAYKKRFIANQDRINKGLRALSPAEYLSKEDAYQEIMRRYGLPESYYTKGDLGIQEGFNKLIANDVSDTELEDRVITAQERVINANPDVLKTLKQYYPGITNGDILAYALDPKNALNAIKKKVTAAEIGAAALGEGLTSGLPRAEELATAGVTAAKYLQAAPFISQAAERGSQLADIYNQTPYTQATAEAEALDLAGSAQAAKQRKKLTGLEQASFSGQAGTAQSALDRGRQGAF